jgi:Cu(I)/Ag(I) efflux system periplasmic protein CusF
VSHSSGPANRLRAHAIKAALLVGLAPALLLVGEARAQGGQNMPSNMGNMPGMGTSKAQATTASGIGTVDAVNVAQRKVKLSHEPIPAINWPAMTMEFPTAASVDLSKVKQGSKVRFTLTGANGAYTVQSISPAQ